MSSTMLIPSNGASLVMFPVIGLATHERSQISLDKMDVFMRRVLGNKSLTSEHMNCLPDSRKRIRRQFKVRGSI